MSPKLHLLHHQNVQSTIVVYTLENQLNRSTGLVKLYRLLQENFNRMLIFNLAALNLRQIWWLYSAINFKKALCSLTYLN